MPRSGVDVCFGVGLSTRWDRFMLLFYKIAI